MHPLLYEPPPISVPENIAIERAALCIHYALEDRGWTIDSATMPEGDKPGEFEATCTRHGPSVTINIIFDLEQVDIEYVKSANCYYKPKKKVIHARCNRWLQNIERDIRHAFSKERLSIPQHP
jgi:hypothetical protein